MRVTTALGVAVGAVALVVAPLSPAAAAGKSGAEGAAKAPGQVCKGTAELFGQQVQLVGELFAKQGGCASTVVTGALEHPEHLSSMISRAGYVQQCQIIRQAEGFPFDFGYDFLPIEDQDVASIGECASVLREIHVLFEQMGPPPGGDGE
jgi:hypothetical protein